MTNAPEPGVRPQFTIGDRLRKARTMRDMEVKQFADLIEVDRNTVSNYELEKTAPEKMKPIVLRQWALATGVDVNWLKFGDYSPDGGGSNLRPMDYKCGSSNVRVLRPMNLAA